MTALPDPTAFRPDWRRLGRREQQRLQLSRAALWLEKLWPQIAPPLIGLALFLGLASLGLWQMTGGAARVAVLVGLAGWAGFRLWRARRALRAPTLLATLMRLDRQAMRPAGELAGLLDRPAQPGTALGDSLWRVHEARLPLAIARTRIIRPHLPWLGMDRFALVPLALLMLALAMLSSQGAWRDRLSGALSPDWRSYDQVRMTATILPPDYVRIAPRTLNLPVDARLSLSAPAGSTIAIGIEGLERRARLSTPAGGAIALESRGERLWQVTAPVGDGGPFRLRLPLRTLAALDISVVPDKPPVVAFAAAPQVSANQSLDIRYRISDDHGASALALVYGRGGRWRAAVLAPPPLQPGSVEGQGFRDLTEDAWAGQRVSLRLAARDPAGNMALSAPVQIELPERRFDDLLAREIIALRRGLLTGELSALMTGLAIEQLSAQPERFRGDLTTFLALRGALHRLTMGSPQGAAGLLWQLALDLDGQQAATGLDQVRAAFEALMQGMGSADEARRLADALEQALGDFLSEQMRQAMANPPAAGDGREAQVLDAAVLDQLFAALKERLAAGDTAGARQIATALQQLMENLRIAPPGNAAARQAAQALMRDLGALRQQQQALQGRTASSPAPTGLAGDQGAMADSTQELENRLRQLPLPGMAGLEAAREAMRGAAAALERSDRPGALAAQQQALGALDAAARQLAAGAAAMAARQQTGRPQGVDPLGRLGPGAIDGAVRNLLPDAGSAARIRAIRRILEDRAADPARSAEERDYLLRLLERF